MDSLLESKPITVRVSKVICAKRWQIFRKILQIQNFPKFMPNVRKVEVLSKNGSTVLTRWLVEADGIPIQWVEEEIFDAKNFSISFKAIEGDFRHFDGVWALKEHPRGTQVEITVNVKVGIPVIEQMVAPVLQDKIYKNFNLMLESLNNLFVSQRYNSFKIGKSNHIKGFAIIGHPYNLNNLIRYLHYLKEDFREPSREFLMKVYELVPAYVMRDIRNFRSKNGKETRGLVIVSTFIPDMMKVDVSLVFNKVVEACKVAEEHFIGVAALGGFTSIVGEKLGQEVSKAVSMPLTTGNTYTVYLALEGVRKACKGMEVNLRDANVTVIGGTGDIGGACARILAEEVKSLTVTGRRPEAVQEVLALLKSVGGRAQLAGTTDNMEAVKNADVVIAAASTSNSILDLHIFKKGAIICDLAYPKNISYTRSDRDDILIFSGGLSEAPCDVDLGFEIGLPSSRTLYGCFAEAVILDLAGRYESFSYGKGNITRAKVDQIKEMALEHGFELAPFYWGDRLITEKEIREIEKKIKR